MSLFHASQHTATISSYELKMRLESQLSRMNCHMFSTGFSSGDLGGSGKIVMLSGIMSLFVICHPARSTMRMAWAAGVTSNEISSKWCCMASVLHRGRTRPAPTPRSGHMAPKIQTDFVRWSMGAVGLLPRGAQRRVSLVFCPTLASSCHHISMLVLSGRLLRIASSSVGKFF